MPLYVVWMGARRRERDAVDLKQLRAIVTVAEVGSVTRAAELLHLVQPAVTRQIRGLEQELGVDLFERTGQGMRPTEAGVVMVERARRALNELERARAEVQPAPGEVTGIVTLGLLESTSDLLAEPLVTALAKDHPGVELRLMTAYSGHLQQWLDDGDLDLTLLYDLDSTPSLNARPLVRERLWAVAPPSAGLHADRPVTFAEAAAHPLVMPAPGHALRRLIDAAAARSGAVPSAVVQTNSLRVQKQLVRAGHGWTVLPGVGIAEDVARGELSAAPLSEPEVWRSVVLGTPRSGRTPPAVEVVARELVRQIDSAVGRGGWPSAQVQGP
jgi:LysR family nitrogen assimilation transcriptional regulator